MSARPPDFDELVGPELVGEERERLLRVHEALVSVPPPPDLSGPLARAPAPARRRIGLLARPARPLALAAALAVTAFAIGVALGGRLSGPDTFLVVTLSGTASAPSASASIDVFDIDAAGNWPMELTVRNLAPAPEGRLYELWLTQDGQLTELCGAFLAEPDGTTTVPMNAPYKLRDADAWVIVEEGSEEILLTG